MRAGRDTPLLHRHREMHEKLTGLVFLAVGHLDHEVIRADVSILGLVGKSIAACARDAVSGALNDPIADDLDEPPGCIRPIRALAGCIARHDHGAFVATTVAEAVGARVEARAVAFAVSDACPQAANRCKHAQRYWFGHLGPSTSLYANRPVQAVACPA